MTMENEDQSERVDEIADTIRDLRTNVEELQSNPLADINPESLDRLKSALERAVEASDDVEDDLEQRVAPHPKE
jgi:hypothetical protein